MCPLSLPLRTVLPVLAGLLVVSLTGCVSSSYRRADKSTPPAVPLGWDATASAPPTELTLQKVVVYQGPGSWKAKAYWDEYGIIVRNRGTTPVIIDGASLEDFQGQFAVPGDDPWNLERQSRTRTEKLNNALGNVVRVGGGVLLPVTGGAIVSATAALASLAGGTALPATFWAGPAIIPVAIGTTIYRNVSSKRGIEREFDRRRLELPLTVEPGQEVAGSLFFPVTPGPRRLTVKARDEQRSIDLTLPLPELARLHLNSQPGSNANPEGPELRPVQRRGTY